MGTPVGRNMKFLGSSLFCETNGVAWQLAVPAQVRRPVHTREAACRAALTRSECGLVSSRRSRKLYRARCIQRMQGAGETKPRPSSNEAAGAGSPPPSTFYQALNQAVYAVQAALRRGERLLEIEFPPLPAKLMNSSTSSAYDVIDANTRLALDFAKLLQDFSHEKQSDTASFQRIALIFPDMIERNRAASTGSAQRSAISGYADSFVETIGEEARIRFAALRTGYEAGNFVQRLLRANIRGGDGGDRIESILSDDEVFIVLGASAQELEDVEKFVERLEEADRARGKQRPVILFNMQLDISRGDLGLPAFPSRKLHHRFLCRFLPVYYLRTRSYSRSTTRPPYVLNYQGAIFRVYPEPYQILLETGDGRYRRVAECAQRPTLHEAKQMLTKAAIPSLDEGKDGGLSFWRKGFQTTTWWERASADASVSNKWRE